MKKIIKNINKINANKKDSPNNQWNQENVNKKDKQWWWSQKKKQSKQNQKRKRTTDTSEIQRIVTDY